MENQSISERKKEKKAITELENSVKEKSIRMGHLAMGLYPLLMSQGEDDQYYYSFHAVLESIEENCDAVRGLLDKIDDVTGFNDSGKEFRAKEKIKEQIEDVFKNHDGMG